MTQARIRTQAQSYRTIFSIVIFHICMSIFQSTLLNVCKPQSKLEHRMLRQCSREKMIMRNIKKIWHTIGLENRPTAYIADGLPTELWCQLKILNFHTYKLITYKLSYLKLIPPHFIIHVDFDRHVFITVFSWMSTVDSILSS